MRSRVLFVFLLACRCLPVFAQAAAIHRLDGKTIAMAEAASFAAAELQRDGVTGAQIAILNGGRVAWTYAYGKRNVEQDLPMTTATNTWAASITKGVFGTWVMQLVEQGRLNLDTPIAKLLPHPLNEYPAYGESAAELVRDPQWQRVTPRMVLSHTSGLSNIVALTEPDKKLRLHFPPGSRFAYSGEGMNLLQLALEQGVIHEPLETAMDRDLFAPLGLERTGMVWKPSFDADSALRYGAQGQYLATTHKANARAAGNMATTVNDLARFTEALLAGKVLQARTMKGMLSPQISIRTAHQFPTLSTEASDEGPNVGLAYGIGWGLLTKTKYGPAFFKEGHGDGAENYMICFTRSGACMVLLTNSDNGELAFRPLLEKLLGDTVTPWVWESYTHEQILGNDEHKHRVAAK